jgi:hypothetical protein
LLSATHPSFGQTCLFTNFQNISTTVRGSKFQGIREKAGFVQNATELPKCDALIFCGCQPLVTHPFLKESQFQIFTQKFTQKFQPEFVVDSVDELSEIEIRPKGGELPTAVPLNPRIKDVHTGTKRRLDVKTNNQDSGISGSGCSNAMRWFYVDAMNHMLIRREKRFQMTLFTTDYH